ncbi:MAG: uroporphyrinogen decarboxylase family protein [Armatimonadota bacterium]
MTDKNWKKFVDIVRNRTTFDVAACLIIDSPWLPSFAGCDTKEYLFIQERWIDTNIKVLNRFPDMIFLPGNWVEFGLVIEPSAFGCPVKWWKDTPPTASHIISDTSQISNLKVPNPQTEGLMPVALQMQSYLEPKMAELGYPTRMVAARGPLAVASQLRGVTELLVDIKIEPDAVHALINLCTESAISWRKHKKKTWIKLKEYYFLMI